MPRLLEEEERARLAAEAEAARKEAEQRLKDAKDSEERERIEKEAAAADAARTCSLTLCWNGDSGCATDGPCVTVTPKRAAVSGSMIFCAA